MVRWWGDRSKWWLTSAEADLCPNGRFWVMWENTKGEKDAMGGHFKTIDQDRGFVLSFVGSHAKSHVDELAIRLHLEDEGTKLVLCHSGLSWTARAVRRLPAGLDTDSGLASAAVLRT